MAIFIVVLQRPCQLYQTIRVMVGSRDDAIFVGGGTQSEWVGVQRGIGERLSTRGERGVKATVGDDLKLVGDFIWGGLVLLRFKAQNILRCVLFMLLRI